MFFTYVLPGYKLHVKSIRILVEARENKLMLLETVILTLTSFVSPRGGPAPKNTSK